jgi:hypothetical protein
MFTATADLTQFRQRVVQTHRALESIQRKAVEAAVKGGRDEARRGEWKDKTGDTRRLLQVRGYSWSGTTMWGEYATGTPWSWFLEKGTPPHEIWPKAAYNAPTGSLMPGQSRRARGKGPHEHIVGRGQALRWKDESGTEFFARMVHHPGTQALNFMWRSETVAKSILLRELGRGFVGLRSVWAA